MSSKKSFAAIALLSAALVACGGGERSASTSTSADSTAASSKPLSVKGSDTMVILTQRLAEEYMKANQGAVVQVNGGGSGTGIAALVNGTTDLAQASRPMKDEERASVEKQRGAKVVETAVAIDALSVFVNAKNTVKELTMAQLSDIYTGKVKNWSEVGGANAPIILYGRESSSGTYDYFKEHVLSKKDFATNVQALQGTAAIINAVAKDPNGLGYGGIAYEQYVRAIGIKKDAASAAIAPSEATVADGTYPLSRKLFLYSLENSPERVTKFVQYCLTPEAQKLVSTVGYFPMSDDKSATGTPAGSQPSGS